MRHRFTYLNIGTVAKVPFHMVQLVIGLHSEMELIMLADGKIGGQFGREHLVDIQLLGQYLGAGTHGIGITFGLSDAIDMGNEASWAMQGMEVVGNRFADERQVGIAWNRTELSGDIRAIEGHFGNIVGIADDIHKMVLHLLDIERGECHLLEGLLHR